MDPTTKVIANWLTRKPRKEAFTITLLITTILFLFSYLFLKGSFGLDEKMIANGHLVFDQHQYYRAWTTLLAHADGEHLISNAFLFIPLTYLLYGYYGAILFPFLGLLLGGFINLIVLKTMPDQTALIGISGVVYWMGATWLTLFLLIDHRKKLRYNFAIALSLTLMLFIPDKYQPNISYLSHLLGFISGALTGFIYYKIHRQNFLQSQVVQMIPPETDLIFDEHLADKIDQTNRV